VISHRSALRLASPRLARQSISLSRSVCVSHDFVALTLSVRFPARYCVVCRHSPLRSVHAHDYLRRAVPFFFRSVTCSARSLPRPGPPPHGRLCRESGRASERASERASNSYAAYGRAHGGQRSAQPRVWRVPRCMCGGGVVRTAPPVTDIARERHRSLPAHREVSGSVSLRCALRLPWARPTTPQTQQLAPLPVSCCCCCS
jgi:hypothetical protein